MIKSSEKFMKTMVVKLRQIHPKQTFVDLKPGLCLRFDYIYPSKY